MKKLLFSLAVCAALFTACSDDDDVKGSLKSDASIIKTEDGDMLLTSNGYWKYSYNLKGQCEYAYRHNDYYFDVTNSKSVVLYYYDDETYVDFSYNGSGFISRAVIDEKWESETIHGEYDDDYYTVNIEYNKSNQISKISVNNKYEYVYSDEEGTYTADVNLSFNYEDGDLKTITGTSYVTDNWEYNGREHSEKWYDDYNIKFTYKNEDNLFRQIPRYQWYYIEDAAYGAIFDYLEPFSYIGWLGKGSGHVLYRTSVTETFYYYDDDEHKYVEDDDWSSSYSVDIEMNDDGTIHYENGYYYHYAEVGSEETYQFEKALTEDEGTSAHSKKVAEIKERHAKYKD